MRLPEIRIWVQIASLDGSRCKIGIARWGMRVNRGVCVGRWLLWVTGAQFYQRPSERLCGIRFKIIPRIRKEMQAKYLSVLISHFLRVAPVILIPQQFWSCCTWTRVAPRQENTLRQRDAGSHQCVWEVTSGLSGGVWTEHWHLFQSNAEGLRYWYAKEGDIVMGKGSQRKLSPGPLRMQRPKTG